MGEKTSTTASPERARDIETVKALAARLDVPLDELAPKPTKWRDPAADDDVDELLDRIVRRAQYGALRQVLYVLDGWREGARSNHDALGHRDESRPCWETWDTGDIAHMVADAARDLGTADPNVGYERRAVEL
jgi:hypothetical protein